MLRATLAVFPPCWLLERVQNAQLSHAPPGPTFLPRGAPEAGLSGLRPSLVPGDQRAVGAELRGPPRSPLLRGCGLACSLETHRCPSYNCTAWSWGHRPPAPCSALQAGAGPGSSAPLAASFSTTDTFEANVCSIEPFTRLLLEHGRSSTSLPHVLLGPWLGRDPVTPVSLSTCQS